LPAAKQAAFTAWRVAKLSEQSSTRSTAATAALSESSSSALRCAIRSISGLIALNRAMGESTLLTPTEALSCRT